MKGTCVVWGDIPRNLVPKDADSKAWPTLFAQVPNVGDYVRNFNGEELRVGAVTYLCDGTFELYLEP